MEEYFKENLSFAKNSSEFKEKFLSQKSVLFILELG